MNHEKNVKYTSYDYKKVSMNTDTDMQYMDGIKLFGWIIDEEKTTSSDNGTMNYILKRNRNIINKAELIRLEKNYEFCFHEIIRLQNSIRSKATICALTIGLIGTCFIAGSTFAITHNPPIVWLCVLLAVPGFIGWLLPYFIFKKVKTIQQHKVEPFIKSSYDEIEKICDKATLLIDVAS